MKAHILSDSDRAYRDGILRALALQAIALHNLYGWGSKPVYKVAEEALRVQEIAKHDLDMADKIETFVKKLEGR